MSVTDNTVTNKFTVLFSSKTGEHITPIELYKEFHFRLDPCTTKDNPLGTTNFYTKENDGLKQSWAPGPVYVNPPYGRDISKWVEKACWEAKDGLTVVMLLPARTDTKWFQDYLYKKKNIDIDFLRGRLRFKNTKSSAPFPLMVVVIRTQTELSN